MRSRAAFLALLAVLAISTSTARAQSAPLPRHALTPGAVETRDTARVCHAGYSATVRPKAAAWRVLRKQVFVRYGIDWHAKGYQADHLIPLAIGGASSVLNVWPEPIHVPLGAISKDSIDGRYLYNLVCRWHRLSLDSAQRLMAKPDGWLVLYRQFHHEPASVLRRLPPEWARP